jgi:cell division protein FtsB
MKKKSIRVILFGVLVWVVYSWLSGESGLINQVRLHQRNSSMLASIDSLRNEKRKLDIQRARLRSDTAYLEKIIRAELGMAKPGEKVYRLIPAP